MQITAEIIPISKYPIQGTIIADVIHISSRSMEVKIPKHLVNGFLFLGDSVPLIIRSHVVHPVEIEAEVTVNYIYSMSEDLFMVKLNFLEEIKIDQELEGILLKIQSDENLIDVIGQRKS